MPVCTGLAVRHVAVDGQLPHFGRGNIENQPFIDKFPYAVIVLAIVGILATYLFHRMVYGRQLLARRRQSPRGKVVRRSHKSRPHSGLCHFGRFGSDCRHIAQWF